MNPNIPNVINQKNLRIWKMSPRVNISNLSIKKKIKKKTKLTLGPGSPGLPGLPRFPGQPCEKTGVFYQLVR